MTGRNREIDDVTGIETTGHTWDGIKELNKPLPRWWVWTFYATIVWAIGYWIVYPAWPTFTGYTKGMWGYSQRAVVADEVKVALRGARRNARPACGGNASTRSRAIRICCVSPWPRGRRRSRRHCAPCHGRGAQGFAGYPNLNDDDWLWGGAIDDIHKTISFGVRSDRKEARASQMPRYGLDKLLEEPQIADVAEYVLSLSGRSESSVAAARGEKVFAEQCASCHGPDGKGKQEQGAPNLTDEIWLYGGSRQAVIESIRTGRGGMMPAWAGRLDPVTLKSLAVYVHSLGGGK